MQYKNNSVHVHTDSLCSEHNLMVEDCDVIYDFLYFSAKWYRAYIMS